MNPQDLASELVKTLSDADSNMAHTALNIAELLLVHRDHDQLNFCHSLMNGDSNDMQTLQSQDGRVEGAYLSRKQEVPLPRVQATQDAEAEGAKTLTSRRRRISAYQYGKVKLELERCQQKLKRIRVELNNLKDANIRLNQLVLEEVPLAIKPVKFLKHAARHLRVIEGESGAVHFLFEKAEEIHSMNKVHPRPRYAHTGGGLCSIGECDCPKIGGTN